jgi:CrcB protein
VSTVRRPDVVPVLAVAGGGAVGAALRWGVGQWLPWHPPAFPWATATVNVVGCLAIGLVLGWLLTTAGQPRWLRPFLATGLLGGFTTFSAFAVETVRLLDDGAGSVALAYVAASLALGLLAVRVGARTVVRIRRA